MTTATRGTNIRKVYLDKVFALHKSEVINNVYGAFDRTDEVSVEDLMKTLDVLEETIADSLNDMEEKTTKQKSPVKRPATIYNVFVKSMIQQLKKKYPQADKNILMKDCGKIWTHLKEDNNFDKSDREKVESLLLKDIKGLPELESAISVKGGEAATSAAPAASASASKAKSKK